MDDQAVPDWAQQPAQPVQAPTAVPDWAKTSTPDSSQSLMAQGLEPQVPIQTTEGEIPQPPIPISDPVNDKIFQQTNGGKILGAVDSFMGLGWMKDAGEAAFQGYSDIASDPLGLSQETQDSLKKAGWFNDYAKGEDDWRKSVLEAVLKPAAYTADLFLRAPYAAAVGVTAGAFQVTGGQVEQNAREAENFVQFLAINSGFSQDGVPLARNPKAEIENPFTPPPDFPPPPVAGLALKEGETAGALNLDGIGSVAPETEAAQSTRAQAAPIEGDTISQAIPDQPLQTKIPPEPTRLLTWIKQQGGIQDETGDVAVSIGSAKERPGLISKNGMAPDDLALRAQKAGFLPEGERPDVNALYDAIREDHNGTPQYSEHDTNAALDYQTALNRNAEIDRISNETGIDTKGETHNSFWDKVADHISQEKQAEEIQSMTEAHVAALKEAEDAEAQWRNSPVYHGTPHEFDNFSTEHVGNGEGNQAFGWGLYFADKKAIAESYKEKLSDSFPPPKAVLEQYFKPGNIVEGYGGKDKVISFNPQDGRYHDSWSVKVQAVDKNGEPLKGMDGRIRTHSTLPSGKALKAAGFDMGKLYQAQIPKDEYMLDWDKRYTEQSLYVQEALKKAGFDLEATNSTGKDLYRSLKLGAFDQLKNSGFSRESEGVSKYLNSIGIKGIKYLDSSSRAVGAGSKNYVIFDDNAIRKIEQYAEDRGRPATLEELENERQQEIAARGEEALPARNDQPGPSPGDQGEVQGGGGQGGRGSEPPRGGGPQGGEGPQAPKGQIIDESGNLNLKYINASDDAKEVLAQTAQAYAEKNGTVVPNIETEAQARQFLDDAMKNTQNGIPDFLANMNRGDPINRVIATAARQLVVQSATEYLQLAKRAGETGDQADIDAATEAYGRMDMLNGTRHEISAEAGRTLQSHQIEVGDANMEAVADKLTNSDMKPEEVHKVASTLDTPQQVAKFVSDTKKPTWGDMALFYMINNYLSGPLTHAAYAAAYGVQSLLRIGVETPIASLVGKIQDTFGETMEPEEVNALQTERSTLLDRLAEADSTQGEPLKASEAARMQSRIAEIEARFQKAQTVMPKEIAARFYGIGQGALDAVQATWKALKTNQMVPLPGQAISDATAIERNPIVTYGKTIDNPVGSAMVQAAGQIIGVPSRVVGALHTFQKFLSYSESLNALAYRQAASEGLEGSITDTSTALGARIAELKANPSPEMMKAATDEGLYASLMGKPGKFGQRLEDIAHTNNYTRAIIPFARVMNNINSQALLERSPIGVFSKTVRDNISGANGNAAQATAIGRMVTGVGVLTGAATLTAYGLANGGLKASIMQQDAETDDGKKPALQNIQAYNYLAGEPPYSVRIGDVNVPLRFLGIPGRVMAIGADLHDLYQANHNEDDKTAVAGMAASAVANNILSESGMRGVAELYQAAKDPTGYGKYYARNAIASAVIPFSVGQSQIDRFTDPEMRQTQDLMESMMSKSPLTSTSLVPRIDIFGNPMMRNGDHSWAEHDPVMQALHQAQLYPAPVGQRLSNVKLSESQYADYAAKAGRLFYLSAIKQVTDPNWVKMQPDDQWDMLHKTLMASRKDARAYMQMQYPELAKQGAEQIQDLADTSTKP